MKNFTLLFFLIITNISYSQNKLDKWLIQAESGDSGADKILIDSEGNTIVFGFFETEEFVFKNMKIKNKKYDPSSGYFVSYFVAKINNKGIGDWLKPIVGIELPRQAEICLDKNSNIYIIGSIKDSLYFDDKNILNGNDKNYVDCLLMKISKDGDFLWGKSIGGDYIDFGVSVINDSSNNVYISGVYGSKKIFLDKDYVLELRNNTKQNIFIAKLSEIGDIVWVNSYYGDKYDYVYKIVYSNNSIFLCGYFSSSQLNFTNGLRLNHSPYGTKISNDAFIGQISLEGNINWLHSINSNDADLALEICPLKNGQLLFGGLTLGDSLNFDYSFIGYNHDNSLSNYFILNLDNNGNLNWSKLVKNKFPNYMYLASNENSFFLGGHYSNRGNIDLEFNYPYLGGSDDFFINKYKYDGKYLGGMTFGGPASEVVLSMTLDKENKLYFSGVISDNYTIFCGDTIFNLFKSDLPPPNSLPTAYPAFIAKINDFSTKSILIDKDEHELFPNPTADFLYLSGINSLEKNNYKFLDISGHVINPKTELKGGKIVFDVSELLPGLYILQVESTVKSYSKKFIVSH